jgi:hypothetical protein
MWTWEHTVPGGQPARAFVWMQGHTYANFRPPDLKEKRVTLVGPNWRCNANFLLAGR